MIYNVYLDGINIYDGANDMILLDPSLKMELNAAGSLEFTMPVYHKCYDLPKLLTSDVEVYENNELIWYGRVVEINISMNKNKTVYCEGPFAFFNDSVQRPAVYDTTTVKEFFKSVISNHNGSVPTNRQFTVGEVTVADVNIYRELNYDKTIDVINRMCLNAEGGYLFFYRDKGLNYVDWLSDVPYESTQPVQFGLNLVDLSQHFNGSNIKTAVLPLGKETDGEKLTIKDINDGLDYLDSDAVSTYGRITEVVEFSEIIYTDMLLSAARKWLSDKQFDPFSIECSAAELHYISDSYTPFRIGQNVRVTSEPHLIDKLLPLTKISIKLDSGVKQISVGTPERRDLSEIYKPSE